MLFTTYYQMRRISLPESPENSRTLRDAFFGNSKQLQRRDSVHLSSVYTDYSFSSFIYFSFFFLLLTTLVMHVEQSVLSVSVGRIANLKGHYFQPSLSVCLSVCVCVSLTGTSTLQRRPILMKLGHKDPTVI